jgi:hypothetical protein
MDSAVKVADAPAPVDLASQTKLDSAPRDAAGIKSDASGTSGDTAGFIGAPTPNSWLFIVGRVDEMSAGERALVEHAKKRGVLFAPIEAELFESTTSPSNAVNFVWGRNGVVISNSGSSAALEAVKSFKNLPVPIVLFYGRAYNMNGQSAWMTPVTSGGGNQPSGEYEGTQVTITATNLALTAGLTGTVTIATSSMHMSWGNPQSSSAIRVATIPDEPNSAAVFAYPPGATMDDGQVAPAARVGFFFDGVDGGEMTADGYKLLDAVLDWAVQP